MNFRFSSGRRAFLQIALALPLIRLLRPASEAATDIHGDDIVEVDGWILKRKDVA